MASYPYDGFTRVVLLTTLANIDAPSLAEIDNGIDITCELTKDGLVTPKSTQAVDRARWHSLLLAEDPGRYGFDNPSLKGKRRTQPNPEPLWDACIYRSAAFLLIRRGIPYEYHWDGDQVVEVISFRFGMRSTLPSAGNTTTTFTVPLFVNDATDGGVLTGHPLLTEDDRAILTEDGHMILVEP